MVKIFLDITVLKYGSYLPIEAKLCTMIDNLKRTLKAWDGPKW